MYKRLTIERIRIRSKLRSVQKNAIARGLDILLIKDYDYICNNHKKIHYCIILLAVTMLFICLIFSSALIDSFLNARCLISSNYIVWEATRPIVDCTYCANTTKPIILWNVTRQLFNKYAYSPKPIIIKNAISSWRATKEFNFEFFKSLFDKTRGSLESFETECQFLSFKTNLFSLKEVFNMPAARARNEHGQEPWYVGWGICHPDIRSNLRQYYSIPNFFPEDAEFPATENIFFGYETGAVMHLDYISRLMWQGQIKGSKIWSLAPVPECDQVCHKFQYQVGPGDIVLLDTRIWYHATHIPNRKFSITLQSEYG